MTILELFSLLLGAVLISIAIAVSITNSTIFEYKERSKNYFYKIFLAWAIVHIALSLNYTKPVEVISVSKSNKVYYLEQYKSEDLVLDKETYDKLMLLGNEDKLYIDQSFWVTVFNDGKEERLSIKGSRYYEILKNKETVVDIKYDTWGNKSLK
jgi:hypothetical protein